MRLKKNATAFFAAIAGFLLARVLVLAAVQTIAEILTGTVVR